MIVAAISPQLRALLLSSSATQQPLRLRIIIYIWIAVATFHISIFSNSALNPTSYVMPTQQSKKQFRTVLSSAAGNSQQQNKDGRITAAALETIPLHPAKIPSLTVKSTSSVDDDDNDDIASPPKIGSSSAAAKSSKQQLLRSPLRTRFGLFRRKLMIDDDDSDDDVVSSSVIQPSAYQKTGTTTTSPQQQQQTPVPTLATTTGILLNNNNKFSIGSLFRGGATTSATTPVTGGGGTNTLLTLITTMFHTIFVQNFCRFAAFIGATKTRCLCLLVFSVFIESYATTLSKQAKDTGNALLFARACLVYLFCMVGFNISLAKLDVSVAYAVWSALGTTLVTVVGFFWFGESLDATKVLYLGMIISGVVGLNLGSGGA